MTTMLEKMARALCVEAGHEPDREFGAPILRPEEGPHRGWEEYLPAARAALLAIREPSADVIAPASSALAIQHGKPTTDRTWTSQFTSMSTRKAFTATIDAILNEQAPGEQNEAGT